jgi:hypothetical protein
VYDLTENSSSDAFFDEDYSGHSSREILPGMASVPVSERRIPIAVSRLGADRAVNLGAYAIAFERLNQGPVD